MYKNMYELLEERELNGWKLQKFEIGSGDLRAMLDGIAPGKYIRLLHNNELVMSDTGMEKRTNLDFCMNARGDIIVGGLGIGMIIMAVQDKPEVYSITVIEKNQEVIDIVASQLDFNEKVNIVCADVFEWEPKHGAKYDMVYLDIWSWVNKDIYRKEMQPLKKKYAGFLKSKSESSKVFNKCWAEQQAKTDSKL